MSEEDITKEGVVDIVAQYITNYCSTKQKGTHGNILDMCKIENRGLGVEGLFKVFIIHALHEQGIQYLREPGYDGIEILVKNKGPDLIFVDKFKLELKASQGQSSKWIRREGLKDKPEYVGVDCMFLAPREAVEELDPYYYREINGDWIVGLIRKEVESA